MTAELPWWRRPEASIIGKVTDREAAERLGVARNTVTSHRRRCRIPPACRIKNPPSPAVVSALLDAGFSRRNVAFHMGHEPETIRAVIDGVLGGRKHKHVEHTWTGAEARVLGERIRAGESVTDIARSEIVPRAKLRNALVYWGYIDEPKKRQ